MISVKKMSSDSGVVAIVDPDKVGVVVGTSVVAVVVAVDDRTGAAPVGAGVVGVPVGALVGEQWPHATKQNRLT